MIERLVQLQPPYDWSHCWGVFFRCQFLSGLQVSRDTVVAVLLVLVFLSWYDCHRHWIPAASETWNEMWTEFVS